MGDIPYPEPTSKASSAVMRANRRADTTPEVRVRSLLHARGYRYRKDYLIRLNDFRVKGDIVFPKLKIVVFIDGCWWHRCPRHSNMPRVNRRYWVPKLEGNVKRDELVTEALDRAGWTVLRIWEHVAPEEAARLVVNALESQTGYAVRQLGSDHS